MKLYWVEPNGSEKIWTGNPARLPKRIVTDYHPDELDQQMAEAEGYERYEKCAEVEDTWRTLRTGQDAAACWTEGIYGDWCGFEWRDE